MQAQTAHLRRSEYASKKQGAFVKIYFILLIIPALIYVIYYIFQKQAIIPLPQPVCHDCNICGLPVENDPIVKVNNQKSYMVGSYIEHRHGAKMIRTIAIVLRSEDAQYHCLLCCNGKKESVSATYEIHSDHFGFEYGTADITCQLPVTCTKPTHVAITSRPGKEDGSSQEIHTLQPVRNQEIPENLTYEFAVCISVMFDYNNVLELVQAMEMFKTLGVQKVAIYKTSCDSNVQKVLDYYVKQKFVELIPWNLSKHSIKASRGWLKSDSSGELHYFGQLSALNDCVYRYMYQSRYVALQDLDEFILPMNIKTWTELLPDLEKNYNNIGAFEFENNFFPLSIKDSNPKYSPDSWQNVPGVNILEHIVRMSNDPTKFNNFKVIIDPRSVFQVTVHGLLQSIRGSVRVDSNIARMYHIREVSNEMLEENNQIPDTHVRDYADSLIPAVSKVLQEALGIN